ncbi:acetylxylan esterase [Modestobacter sp. VKM Ac-2977]|uniref:acetylxylan esterase n=1 Tax=Modestobacter sp. VKM Ac-2977 TaxID=3004131 RepID=UPI0022A9FD23|nr:acetylxylan esterase [Modestobacter sp. VKM Ac-2977]MCZ2822685.1 acetylxylan esterase [Modestobacter sp. VKM Ac-2977]
MALFDLPLDVLESYRPTVDEPEDFDAFWSTTLAEASSHELLLHVEAVDTALVGVETWDVTFSGAHGHPVRAWYSRPAGRAGDQLPGVVEYLGYGRGRGCPQERLTWATAGYAHLLMDTRGQGGSHGSGGATADPVGAGPATPGFVTRGVLDPSDYYYCRLITDAVRAVEALRALPGVDGSRVSVVGNSQGGGLALAAAGLVPDLAAALPSVPFLCHVRRAVDITDADPYGEIVRYLATHRTATEQVFRTLSYVDGVHLARRANAPALFAVGLRDTICPPSTVFAAYNHYAGRTGVDVPREIAVYPFNHHEGGEALHVDRQLRWLRERVPAGAAGPAGT